MLYSWPSCTLGFCVWAFGTASLLWNSDDVDFFITFTRYAGNESVWLRGLAFSHKEEYLRRSLSKTISVEPSHHKSDLSNFV